MANSPVSALLDHVRRAVLARECEEKTDGQLLERFVTHRDEVAFAALVRRHGPMVWAVCRRALACHHDAEDAFQATFLILVRKAGSVTPREMVGNWLHGVAYQTARKARAMVAKKRGRERPVAEVPEVAVGEERGIWQDLQPLLDQELTYLSNKHRAVVVLCDLEGMSRKEAAGQLGVPEGTVAGWLARARTKLAARLTRRGVHLSSGMMAALLSPNAASASVPGAVLSSTIETATLFAAGNATAAGMIPSGVVALTEGVLRSMLLNKLKVPLAALLVCLACLGGGAWRLTSVPAKADESEPIKVVKGGDHTFPGKWVNIHKDSPLTRRVVIEKKNDEWTVQTWDVGDRKEVEGQKVKLHLLHETDIHGTRVGALPGQPARLMHGFATQSDKIADRHLTLRIEKDVLIVETYTIFKDDRTPRHFRCEFKKAD
jgi:RNA polymerase sigma factor (sigma-70 family)